MRIRINFSKTEIIKYSSHLDLYRAWERTLRRAALPLTYSQGFKPHPHINLGCALPLGFTSENDLVDIWLDQNIPLLDITKRLNQAVPPGIVIKSVEEIPDGTPTLQKQLFASVYDVTIPEQIEHLADKIDELLKSETIERERNGKTYDLRPLIIELTMLTANSAGNPRMKMVLQAKENATGRPEEVLLTLGIDPLTALVHRQELLLNKTP